MASTENKQIVNFMGGSALTRYSQQYENELLINAAVIPAQTPNARSPSMFVPRVGKTSVIDKENLRGCYYSNSVKKVFIVTSTQLIRYDSNFTNETVLLTFDTELENDPLFEENYSSAMVWLDNKAYEITSTAIRQISSTNLGTGRFSSLTFSDGYVLASVRDTNQFIRSELNGLYFSDGINFTNIQSNDNLVCMSMLNNEIWMFCERHTEVFYDSGASADQPFVRQQGRVYPVGTKSKNAVHLNGALYTAGAQEDNTSGSYRWTSAGPELISFDYLNKLITDAVEVKIVGTLEQNRTMIHYIIDNEQIWSYCVDSKTWAKREENDLLIDAFSIDGQFFGIDKVGIFSMSGTTDRGQTITCSKQMSAIHANEQRMFHKLLECDVAGNTYDIVQLYISDDGAQTWRNVAERRESKVGAYNRLRFQRLGSSRSRVYKIVWSNTPIFSVMLDVEAGTK